MKTAGFSVPVPVFERVQALAERDGISPTAVIRQLVQLALPLAEMGHGIDITRLIVLAEKFDLQLDTLLAKLAPEEVKDLHVVAQRRAAKHHGA